MVELARTVPALERGLDVLELMAQASEPLSLTEIARSLERTVSEVQRTVASLLGRAYLVRDARGTYRLSSKLYRIASGQPPFRDLSARALPAMQRFAELTRESVHLGVLADEQLLLVAQVEGRGVIRLSLQVGMTQDLLSTVSGRLLLAGAPAAELEQLLRRRGKRLRQAELARIQRELERIRRQGFEHARSGRVEGVRDLGVPVKLPDGRVLAALTSSWLAPLDERRAGYRHLLRPLRQAAAQIASSYEQ